VSSAGESRDELRRVQTTAVHRLIDAARAGTAGDELDNARVESIAERAIAIASTGGCLRIPTS
jgi:3-keto-L-gulonate-6-phosphate decarboxylase